MSAPGPLVIVEARWASSPIPGIALDQLGDGSVLELLLRRLLPLASQASASIVVVTSDLGADDPIARLAERLGVGVVRGSEDDPLATYAIALVRNPVQEIVRIQANSPLSDPYVVMAALDLHRSTAADLTTNLLPRTYPEGLDVEVMTARALRTAAIEVTEPYDRAHVTSYLHARPERFRIANLESGHDAARERWVAESPADLQRLREIVAQLPDPLTASWNRILSVVGRGTRILPGQLTVKPRPSADPGSSPWVRTWSAHVDGLEVGTIEVSAERGAVTRSVKVAHEWREAATDALYRLLLNDHQTRA